jgi:hypothetical protein
MSLDLWKICNCRACDELICDHHSTITQQPTTTTMTSIIMSIVYPNPLQQSPSSSVLQPFFISVSFLGSLPPHILTREIVSWFSQLFSSCLHIYFPKPLQILVSLPQEYASFTSLVLLATLSSPAITSVSIEDLKNPSKVMITVCIPAFPCSFNPPDQ